MENTLKKIFTGKVDDLAHLEFIKYGKGNYTNKYLINAKKQSGEKWAIKTGSEFANFLVRRCLEGVSGNVKVKGIIVATFKVADEAKFPVERIKQFMGIKQAVINTETLAKNITDLMDKFPKAFFALSFSTDTCNLKIKAKAPKSAKPAASGQKPPVPDFCSLKTIDKDLVKELFFDVPDFKQVEINHTLQINQIVLPKGETDPVKIREMAKRKGIIKREVTVDGKKNTSEKELIV